MGCGDSGGADTGGAESADTDQPAADVAAIDVQDTAPDEVESPYACGWIPRDPGNLVSTGAGEGDTIANLTLIDQCGEAVKLWDFAGKYHVLFLTAAW
jgi:cytochrome oxidase Cu insertion factor (SCO1/SenC/PrrC family)